MRSLPLPFPTFLHHYEVPSCILKECLPAYLFGIGISDEGHSRTIKTNLPANNYVIINMDWCIPNSIMFLSDLSALLTREK